MGTGYNARRCGYCPALIVWVRSAAGKPTPCEAARVDFAIDPSGTDKALLGDGEEAVGYMLAAPAEGSVKAYRPHFPRCPGADAARRDAAARRASSARGAPPAAPRKSEAAAKAEAEAKEKAEKRARAKAEKAEAEAAAAREAEQYEQTSLFPKPRESLKEIHYAYMYE